MKNSLIRFAINDDGSIHDYKFSREHAPTGQLDDGFAVWDLAKLKQLIEANKHVEDAIVREAVKVANPVDKVEEAKDSFAATIDAMSAQDQEANK